MLAAMLFQPPAAVTVMEPWDGMRYAPKDLFASIHKEISETGCLARGKLDIAALNAEKAVRWIKEGTQRTDLKGLSENYLLGIKWPAFWRYMELLPRTKFILCVRDPLEVINSFKKQGGRLGQGLMYDTAFNRSMNESLLAATNDAARRRVLLYSYISERVQAYCDAPNVYVARYERWFSEPEVMLAELSEFLGVQLTQFPVQLRNPPEVQHLTDTDLKLIQEHAGVAAAFGYTLPCGSPSV